MECPKCNYPKTEVMQSRDLKYGERTRRRVCRGPGCNYRFNTLEIVTDDVNSLSPKMKLLRRIKKMGPKTIDALLLLTDRDTEKKI
jgi:transcriptional regulator NrdR family protein